MKAGQLLLLGLLALPLAGCSTIGGWFSSKQPEVEPEPLVDFVPLAKVQVVWDRDIGEGADEQQVKLQPLVDIDRVYAADREGRVAALELESGRNLWEVELDLPLAGGPGVGEGLVALGTSDAEVVALDADSGELKWRARVSSEALSVPRVARGLVLVHTIDGRLSALDAESGELVWGFQLSVPTLTLRGSSSPLISGYKVICGFANGKLVALDLDSGRLLWEASVTTPSGRSELERMVDLDTDPVIYDGVIYVGTFQGEVAAVGEETGAVLWRKELSTYAGLTVDWRRLYVTDADDQVWGIDPRNAAALWRQDKLRARRVSAPAVVGEYLVVGDYQGYLHWLDKSDGSMVARSRVGRAGIRVQPQTAGDLVIVYGDKGELAALRIDAASVDDE
jgi:outer membrane protein assembly factor BamB